MQTHAFLPHRIQRTGIQVRWERRAFLQATVCGVFGISLLFAAGCSFASTKLDDRSWVTAWTTAPLPEEPGKDTPPLQNCTVRHAIRVTAAGASIRIRFSNRFGAELLRIGGATLARAATAAAMDPGTMRTVRFNRRTSVTLPPGTEITSDPVDLHVESGTTLGVAFQLQEVPRILTVHTAARSHAYSSPGNSLSDPTPGDASPPFTRWYFLTGVEVLSREASAIAVLGDSIADGYGCPPDTYTRWPDVLARRLQSSKDTASLAVLNLGIGGNRLLRDGLGPRALSRIDTDIFSQPGVRFLILALGINDIGTRIEARKKGTPFASAADIIGALQQLAEQARARGLKVIGATLTPYAGADFYFSEDGEADRQTINRWIRSSRVFDAVIDFDAVLRDPRAPARLANTFDSGDHLHPSIAGYAEMGRSIDLTLFTSAEQMRRVSFSH